MRTISKGNWATVCKDSIDKCKGLTRADLVKDAEHNGVTEYEITESETFEFFHPPLGKGNEGCWTYEGNLQLRVSDAEFERIHNKKA
jgi:hypothetical protein